MSFNSVARKLPEGSPLRDSAEHALTNAERILVEGRNRIIRLRPNYLASRNLAEAFESIAADLHPEGGVRFTSGLEGKVEEMSPAVLLELYNIGREAIANAFRHADATKVDLTCTCGLHSVVLKVSDDGRGFDTENRDNNPRTGHWGLHDMEQRAKDLGARFECHSRRAVGTEIVVTIPGRRAYARASKR